MNKICVDWDSKTDNNNGYIYGIEYQDQEGNVIDIDWFKTEEERNTEINRSGGYYLWFINYILENVITD